MRTYGDLPRKELGRDCPVACDFFFRTHEFREVTTRRHYPGPHALSLRINGVDTPEVGFELAGYG